MENNAEVLLFGLGVADPKRFFGTTNGLLEKFGTNRVFECPTSENAYLGHALGLALNGYSPIVHFQRMDFMLYAFDQLINNIAKWNDMFHSDYKINLVIRTLIGMGWGQGAQHSQNFSSFFTQIPGLKVVAPTCPESASKLLELAINDGSPVIFTEHRWLQNLSAPANSKNLELEIGKAFTRSTGEDLLIVSWSYGIVEALRFKSIFPELNIEIIDLLTLYPLDIDSILKSFKKIKNIIIWEPAIAFGGIGAEIITQIHEHGYKGKFLRLGNQHTNLSASPIDFKNYYQSLDIIVEKINYTFSLKLKLSNYPMQQWPIDKENIQWSPWL
jgi:pyruvate dehydrogenase E1 component beta subunit